MKISKFLQDSVKQTTKPFFELAWDHPEVYGQWLSQTYHFVKYTTRLISFASSAAASETEDKYHHFFLKHLPEEAGHEKILLVDLKNLKQKLAQPLPSAIYMVDCHKQSITKNGCSSHFGYMLYLENLSITVGVDIHKKLTDYHGPKTVNFLKVHSKEDVDHVSGTIDFIEKNCSQQDQKEICRSIVETCENYTGLISEIISKTTRRQEAS